MTDPIEHAVRKILMDVFRASGADKRMSAESLRATIDVYLAELKPFLRLNGKIPVYNAGEVAQRLGDGTSFG